MVNAKQMVVGTRNFNQEIVLEKLSEKKKDGDIGTVLLWQQMPHSIQFKFNSKMFIVQQIQWHK